MVKIVYIVLTVILFIVNYVVSITTPSNSIFPETRIQVIMDNIKNFLYFNAVYFFAYWLFLVLKNKTDIEQRKKWKKYIIGSFIYLIFIYFILSIINFKLNCLCAF